MSLGCDHLWKLASAWTTSHRVLIRCIASPYLAHMGCSTHDLESEALLTAYQTLSSLLQNDKDLALMGSYFRVVFKCRCIKLTMGVDVVTDYDLSRLYVVQEENVTAAPDPAVIEAALAALTHRQRQVTRWILCQPTPASVERIGQRFGITSRRVRSLINTAISRIENGHRRVCKTISSLA